MRTVILYASVHHGNTKRVTEVMAKILEAELVDVTKETPPELASYDLIGFASGIYFQDFHKAVNQWMERAPFAPGQKVFLAATCGAPFGNFTRKAQKRLKAKGAKIAGTFQCRGFDTFGPFGKIGGIAKGHPTSEDLARAEQFARELRKAKFS